MDASNVRVGAPGNDLHYNLTGFGAAQVVTQNFPATPGFPIGPWFNPNTSGNNSNWVSVTTDASASQAATDFVYTTTFDLTGYTYKGITLTGEFAADNSAVVSLNGTNIGTVSGFSSLTGFSTSNLALFLPTVNTLTFTVTNGGGPTGLIVNNPTLTFASPELNGSGVPALFLAAGVLLLSDGKRRNNSVPA